MTNDIPNIQYIQTYINFTKEPKKQKPIVITLQTKLALESHERTTLTFLEFYFEKRDKSF